MIMYVTFTFDKKLSDIETIYETNLTLSEALEKISKTQNLFYVREDYITENGKFKLKIYGTN